MIILMIFSPFYDRPLIDIFLLLSLVQLFNATNGTLRYDEKQRIEFESSTLQPQQILLPTTLSILQPASLSSNETVPFPDQPVLILRDNNGAWVEELSGNTTWMVTASLEPNTGDPNARLEGILTVPFIDGYANFTNLAISHNGTGYGIKYEITSPPGQSLETSSTSLEIKERILGYNFEYNLTDVEININIQPSLTVTVFDIANGETINTEWKGLNWMFSTSLYDASNSQQSNNLNGLHLSYISSGQGILNNLTISSIGQYYFELSVSTNPTSSYSVVHTTPIFNATLKEYYLHIAVQPGDCNDTVACGVQPVLEVRNKATHMLISNLEMVGRWTINASICDNSAHGNSLSGSTYREIGSPRIEYIDLSILKEETGLKLCFNVTVSPSSDLYNDLNANSILFDVDKRKLFMFELVPPGQADENKVFNQQPIIEIRDEATNIPAYPLTEQWVITVSLANTNNGGSLNGNLSVNVDGVHANFTDLTIDVFGVGYKLEFTSNMGVNVSNFENNI